MHRTPRTACALLVLAGCSDFGLWRQRDQEVEPGPPEDTSTEDTASQAEEVCNGKDDDGDGLVDEGFGDLDGDGIADCVDDDCEAEDSPAGTAGLHEECDGVLVEPTADPWSTTIEWVYLTDNDESGSYGVQVMPVVGQLDDDNGDGVVDANDTPDVALVGGRDSLLVLSGDDGSVQLSEGGYCFYGAVSMADVDADGAVEILAVDEDGRVVSHDATGAVEWRSERLWGPLGCAAMFYNRLTVADLAGDGAPEVITNTAILSGADGTLVGRYAEEVSEWVSPIVADLDQDGSQEILMDCLVFDHHGDLEFALESGIHCGGMAVVDADGDEEAEIASAVDDTFFVHDADGALLAEGSLPTLLPGPMCAGDFDGDKRTEVAVTSNEAVSVYELNGNKKWSFSPPLGTNIPCSTVDLDGDGRAELLYQSMASLYVFDGSNGRILFEVEGLGAKGPRGIPVPADVDGDGAMELIASSSQGFQGSKALGLWVLGHDGDGWAPGGQVWGMEDFSVTNLLADSSIPAEPEPYWRTHHVFRGRPATDSPPGADLSGEFIDVCAASCERGPMRVSWQVANHGLVDVEGEFNVALYAMSGSVEDPELELLDIQVAAPLPVLETSISGEFELHPASVRGRSLVLSVDDDGQGNGEVEECLEDNNQDRWENTLCPE